MLVVPSCLRLSDKLNSPNTATYSLKKHKIAPSFESLAGKEPYKIKSINSAFEKTDKIYTIQKIFQFMIFIIFKMNFLILDLENTIIVKLKQGI